MISEFKFYNELNFFFKNNEPFVVFKKPSHNKIVCQQGDVVDGQISDMHGKRGFIFMPFNSNLNGYLLTPKTTIETQFQLKLNKNQNTDFAEMLEGLDIHLNFTHYCLTQDEEKVTLEDLSM